MVKRMQESQQSRMERVKPCSEDSKVMHYRGFEQDFEDLCSVLSENGEKKAVVAEPQAALMLFELGFINEKQNEEVEMAAELLDYIKHEEEGKEPSIKLEDMKTLLTAVMNFQFDWMLADESSQEKEADFKLTPREIAHLHKKFFQLSQNRQDHVMRKRAEKKAKRKPEPEPLGKPTLNSKSMQIVKDKKPSTKNYADYLIQKGKEYEKHKKELADE